MAYFRCGSGGMPAGLQSGMDAVLNKKFGTSTTYPPSGWPSDVNLLGPLPVKTASGAIASFSDGADDVPVKSCVSRSRLAVAVERLLRLFRLLAILG